MKIGIDGRMYGPQVSGIGNYVKYLTDALFSIDTENEYIMFLRKNDFMTFQCPNMRVKKVLAPSPWYSLSEQTRFIRDLYRQKLDLMHFPNFNTPLLYRKKFIVTIHDITPKFFSGPRVKKSLLRKIAYNRVVEHSVAKSAHIITVSYHSKEDIIKYLKADPSKISVTYLGFPQRFGGYKKYGIMFEFPYIFYIGVWREHKNIPGLLQAFKILLNKHNKLRLVLGGDNTKPDPKIQQTIEKLGMQKKIVVQGFIPENDLPGFYSNAELLVIPSFFEGFGLHGLEALSLGCPVAASKTTSLPEILQDAALYFDPSDPKDMAQKIENILADKELKNALLKNAPRILKRYSWTECARQTKKIYETC